MQGASGLSTEAERNELARKIVRRSREWGTRDADRFARASQARLDKWARGIKV